MDRNYRWRYCPKIKIVMRNKFRNVPSNYDKVYHEMASLKYESLIFKNVTISDKKVFL